MPFASRSIAQDSDAASTTRAAARSVPMRLVRALVAVGMAVTLLAACGDAWDDVDGPGLAESEEFFDDSEGPYGDEADLSADDPWTDDLDELADEADNPTAGGLDTASDQTDAIADEASAPETARSGMVRDDVVCDADGLGEDTEFEFLSAHYVVDGRLGALCHGDSDPSLEQAWDELAVIAPRLQLADLALFGGFVADGDAEEVTLAFVNALDDEGTAFQMSVNLDAYDEDADEATLTMAHEFSHVFTSLNTQLDRGVDSEECATYHNGEGCYLDGAVMASWVDRFWDEELLDGVDPFSEPSTTDGEARCALEPGFLGSYAATNPEEDFAESFSAFVYRVEAPTDAVQAKLDWMGDQPGLAEFRDRADAADLDPVQGAFEQCGGG